VEFLGWKNIPEMAGLLMLSDIGIIPHIKSEHTDHTIPNKLYQYAYANKPIITSNCRPLERLVKEMNIGLSYQHDSVEDFVSSFIKLTKKSDYKKLGENGRKFILEKYNWEKTVEPLLDLYQSFLKQ
jgi:glycosyltransferase involved in cell wall biosynthesis